MKQLALFSCNKLPGLFLGQMLFFLCHFVSAGENTDKPLERFEAAYGGLIVELGKNDLSETEQDAFREKTIRKLDEMVEHALSSLGLKPPNSVDLADKHFVRMTYAVYSGDMDYAVLRLMNDQRQEIYIAKRLKTLLQQYPVGSKESQYEALSITVFLARCYALIPKVTKSAIEKKINELDDGWGKSILDTILAVIDGADVGKLQRQESIGRTFRNMVKYTRAMAQ